MYLSVLRPRASCFGRTRSIRRVLEVGVCEKSGKFSHSPAQMTMHRRQHVGCIFAGQANSRATSLRTAQPMHFPIKMDQLSGVVSFDSFSATGRYICCVVLSHIIHQLNSLAN